MDEVRVQLNHGLVLRQTAEQQDTPRHRSELERLSLQRMYGGGRDDDVSAAAVRGREQGRRQVVMRRVDDDVRPGAPRRRSAGRGRFGTHDEVSTTRPSERDVEEPDGTATADQYRIAAVDVDLALAAQNAR